MKRVLTIAATCCILGYSCKVNKVSEQPFYKLIFEESSEEFKDFEYSENEASTRVLCAKKSKSDSRLFTYQVFDLQQEVMIYENSFIGSGISWKNNAEVAISGTSRIEPGQLRIINVITKESRISKSQEKNK